MTQNIALLSQIECGFGGFDYSRFHPRVWSHDGCVVDLGCAGWDWSAPFLGKKRVIGCDPCETSIAVGADLFRGFVGSFCGSIRYANGDPNRVSGLVSGDSETEVITLKELSWRFRIKAISLLKINIEGMEYDLLIHLQEPLPDQIVVSFHDYPRVPANNERATKAIVDYLSHWYDWCLLDVQWSWYLFLKR